MSNRPRYLYRKFDNAHFRGMSDCCERCGQPLSERLATDWGGGPTFLCALCERDEYVNSRYGGLDVESYLSGTEELSAFGLGQMGGGERDDTLYIYSLGGARRRAPREEERKNPPERKLSFWADYLDDAIDVIDWNDVPEILRGSDKLRKRIQPDWDEAPFGEWNRCRAALTIVQLAGKRMLYSVKEEATLCLYFRCAQGGRGDVGFCPNHRPSSNLNVHPANIELVRCFIAKKLAERRVQQTQPGNTLDK